MERLGRYSLRRRIETSATGVVYLVRDSATNRDVVVKMGTLVSSNGVGENGTHPTSARQKEKPSGAIEHRSLVPVQEVFEELGLLWQVMEYVPGRPLETLLSDESFLQRERIRGALRQIADCLDYAHQKGIVHRHLSPGKVIVQPEGTVRVLGLGLRGHDEDADRKARSKRQRRYLAPEQIAGAPGDARSDQYALAAIAYRVFAGAAPPLQNGQDPQGSTAAGGLRTTLDPGIRAVLEKGMADQPAERYDNCLGFVEALEKALDKVPLWPLPRPHLFSAVPAPTIDETEGLPAGVDAAAIDEDGEHTLFPVESEPAEPLGKAVWLWLLVGILAGSVGAYTFLSDHTPRVVSTPAVSIAQTALPAAKIGSEYVFEFSTTGGTVSRWNVADGRLPDSLVMSGGGTLWGIPTVAGTFPVTVEAMLSTGEVITKAFSLEVASGLRITTPAALPTAVVGLDYAHSLEAEEVQWPWTWSLAEGSLPPDLALDPSTGRISGEPGREGEFSFSLELTDASRARARQVFTLTVDSDTRLSIAGSLPGGIVGRPYVHRLAGAGGAAPYAWSLARGSWPPGVSLDTRGGRVRGTPNRAGSYRVTLRVTDANQLTADRTLTLNIAPAVHFTEDADLPEGKVGATYVARLTASGGRPPFAWRIVGGTLPDGLVLDSSSGVLRGTAASGGTFEFTGEVTDATDQAASQTFRLRMDTPLVVVTNAQLPDAEAGASYTEGLRVSQGSPPYRWDVVDGEIPPGLRLDLRTGRLGGTPGSPGQYRFTARVTDSDNLAASRDFTLAVREGVQVPADLQLPAARTGEPYNFQLRAAGGAAPYTWSVAGGSLPPGVTLRPETGDLVGTPAQTGTYPFSLAAASASGGSATRAFQLTVGAPLSGEIVWQGRLEGDQVLTIQDGQFPSTGTLSSTLPGGPIEVEVEPAGVSLVQAPSAANNWGILVIHAGSAARNRIVIKWNRSQ